ncbi:cytochrome P450 [Pisolithus orientalis]|uniref:cytochrome P450 n=1 Tax=Pisolithus orientalis TaxID=936130 RepID=UPI0022246B9B|nr:cytochrome P450 [Pisolithus orientalis]KAI6006592.1 cytochrome P450 [Pisolithus orientalis]
MSSPLFISTACIIGAGLWLAIRITRKKSNLPYPPGPRQLPIVGNAFDVNLKEPHITYTEWGKTYGEIVYCHIFGQDIIIVNSGKMARTLAEGRSTIYSDRPHSPLFRLFGADHITGILEYGKEWKSQRKLLHLGLRHDIVDRYHELHLRSAHQLVENIQRDSKSLYNHLDLYTATMALEFTYGRRMDGKNDPIISMAASLAEGMTTGVTAERVGLLAALPILKYIPSWFPGAAFQDEARRCRNMMASFANAPFAKAKEQATTSTLKVLVLAMILNPEIQNKAHAELDAVVGKGVLPTFEDRKRLPYLQAVLFEAMRWNPVIPLAGFPHATTTSGVVEGYYIPKGTFIPYCTISTDIRAMSKNEYEDPERFDPTRHLTSDGKLKPNANQDNTKYFGFGRRSCPGRLLACDSLWAAAAVMLSAFRFEKAKDSFGNEIEIDPIFLHGVLNYPPPYPCSIISRINIECEGK